MITRPASDCSVPKSYLVRGEMGNRFLLGFYSTDVAALKTTFPMSLRGWLDGHAIDAVGNAVATNVVLE